MSARYSSLAQLTLMRVREFLREPEAVFWTFVFPVLLALLLGVAFSGGREEPILVGVERGPGAEAIMADLAGSPALRARLLDAEEGREALRRGGVAIVVAGGPEGVVYRLDPTRPDSRAARTAVNDALQRAAGREDPLAARIEPVSERGSRYIDFLIPGLIGFSLLGTGLWGVGYTVVRMRAGHLLKRFMATPMRRWEFLLSFMLGRMVFLFAELALILGFAALVFDVGIRGSLLSVLFICVLGAFTFTGLGLLVASRARTTEGVTGMMNLAAFPMWILSGIFFSRERFPDAMQPLIQALPLTPFLDALRAVMNEGAPLSATGIWLAMVLGWGLLCFGLALGLFRWR